MRTTHFRNPKAITTLCGIPETSGEPETNLSTECDCFPCILRYLDIYGRTPENLQLLAPFGSAELPMDVSLTAAMGTRSWD